MPDPHTDWKWSWSATNAITIYEPNEMLTAYEVATIMDPEIDEPEGITKGKMEARAQLICDAVNEFRSIYEKRGSGVGD